jgi:hypothetical protein
VNVIAFKLLVPIDRRSTKSTPAGRAGVFHAPNFPGFRFMTKTTLAMAQPVATSAMAVYLLGRDFFACNCLTQTWDTIEK